MATITALRDAGAQVRDGDNDSLGSEGDGENSVVWSLADVKRRRTLSAFWRWLYTLLRLAWTHSTRHVVMFAFTNITMWLIVFLMTFVFGAATFAPSIITRLVELDYGQTDLVMSSQKNFKLSEPTRAFLNYTAATALWRRTGFDTFAARQQFNSQVAVQEGGEARTQFVAFDTEQEAHAGIGDWSYPPTPLGACYVTSSLAESLSLVAGDDVNVTLESGTLMAAAASAQRIAEIEAGKRAPPGEGEPVLPKADAKKLSESHMLLTLRVAQVLDRVNGKFARLGDGVVQVMMELRQLGDLVRAGKAQMVDADGNVGALPDKYMRAFGDAMDSGSITSQILLQIPQPRSEYSYSDSTVVRDAVLARLRPPVYKTDFRELDIDLPILYALQGYDFLSLFLGLLTYVALVVFLLLAWVILYSLFSYSVDTRNYEAGVLRLVGLTKGGLVQVIVAQVLLISVPTWFFGLGLAQTLYAVGLRQFGSSLGLYVSPWLPFSAYIVGTVLGLLVPALAAILPLRRALSYTPVEAFANSRPRMVTSAKVTIRRDDARITAPVLLVCCVTVVLGFVLYYLFPLSFLSFRVRVLIVVFLLLLLAMLMGLCLLFVNLDGVLVRVAFWLGFFWERSVVKRLVRSNLLAHRKRNRQTFVMYTLTVSLVIYLDVITRTQTLYLQSTSYKTAGAEFAIRSTSNNFLCCREEFEQTVANSSAVSGFTWVSRDLNEINPDMEPKILTVGKSYMRPIKFQGVLANFDRVAFPYLNAVEQVFHSSSGSWSEYLYSDAGHNSALVQQGVFDELGLDEQAEFLLDCDSSPPQPYARLKPSAVYSTLAGFDESKQDFVQPVIVSMDNFVKCSCGAVASVDEVPMREMLIRTQGATEAQYDKFRVELSRVVAQSSGNFNIVEAKKEQDTITEVNTVLLIVFAVANVITLAVCLFSLITSMYSNKIEQENETASLRALGITTFPLLRATFAETVSLLLTATLTGVFNGWLVAFTQSVQNSFFLDVPTVSVVPWLAIAVVLLISVLSAVLSALLVTFQGRRSIASVLRKGA